MSIQQQVDHFALPLVERARLETPPKIWTGIMKGGA